MRLTQDYAKGKWKYADAEDFFAELMKRKQDTAMSVIDESLKEPRAGGASHLSAAMNANTTANEEEHL